MTNNIRCTCCGTTGLQQGFILDNAPAGRGDTRWVAGLIERGPLGRARTARRLHLRIDAFRCHTCGHLEMFATQAP